MGDAVRVWFAYVGASVRSQMQYRTSFMLGAVGQLFATAIEFLGLWALFDRFGSLRGWTLAEVAMFYGVAHLALALADMFAGGFDQAGELIRKGDLDRMLLRPRSTMLQLLGYELTLRRLGRMVQGGAVLTWSVVQLAPGWHVGEWLFMGLIIVCAACMFLGLFSLQATMSIWTVQTLELINCTTYGGVFAGQHPFDIYERWFRWLFTFLVPLGCVIYFPVLSLMDRADTLGMPAWFGSVSLLAGPVFLALCIGGWNWGVLRYTSTGS